MKKLKGIFSFLLACLFVSASATIVQDVAMAEVGTGAVAEDIYLDLDKYQTASNANVTTTPAYVEIAQSGQADAITGDTADSVDVGATLRIGLGNVDLSAADEFRFLMKSSGAPTRIKMGFIDNAGTAYITHHNTNADDISYLNYSGVETEAGGVTLNYLGGIFLKQDAATYIRVKKTAFTHVNATKTGTGTSFAYGYNDASESATIDWTNIESVFIDFMSCATKSTKNFYSVDMVDITDTATTITEIANANYLTKIEKPAYSKTNSGYGRYEYSFGARPIFEAKDCTYFSHAALHNFNFTVKKDLTADSDTWTTDGISHDLTNYNAFSYYVDTTALSGEGETEIQWYIKDGTGNNYGGNSTAVQILDDGEVKLTSRAQFVPNNFKGRILIPFSDCYHTENSFAANGDKQIQRMLLHFATVNNKATADSKIVVKEAKFIANYDEIVNAAMEADMQAEIDAFSATFNMTNGASIRIAEDYGLRFSINMDSAKYTALLEKAKTLSAEVETGAILKPTDKLSGALTLDNAATKAVATKWAIENQQFYATLGNEQLSGHLGTQVTVRGYVKITLPRDEVIIIYTEYCTDNNGEKIIESNGQVDRSTKDVAQSVSDDFTNAFKNYSEDEKQYAEEVLNDILTAASNEAVA